MLKKHPRIIYFINGPIPTDEDVAAAQLLGSNVVFRNASFARVGTNCETCEGVAGAVPAHYAEAFPAGADVMAAFFASIAPKKVKAAKAEVAAVVAPAAFGNVKPTTPASSAAGWTQPAGGSK